MPDQIHRQTPLNNQESVWDYPRPPRVEATTRLVRVEFNGQVIAESSRAYRVLETSHPPVYYIPPQDVHREFLIATPRHTVCEFKGLANYWTVRVEDREVHNAAWSYPAPARGYEVIVGHLAFYPSKMDACFVEGERVQAQDGDFYGGWITSNIVGPFKGAVGTHGW
jgi:uncharacterized protein (DUF427 family)